MFKEWVWLNETRHVQQKTIAHLWLFTGHTAHFLWIKFNRIITKLGLDKKKPDNQGCQRLIKLITNRTDELGNWCLKCWQGAWALQARAGRYPWQLCFHLHVKKKCKYHMKGWAPGLTLKKRPKAIWKWPIIESRIFNWLMTQGWGDLLLLLSSGWISY